MCILQTSGDGAGRVGRGAVHERVRALRARAARRAAGHQRAARTRAAEPHHGLSQVCSVTDLKAGLESQR